MSEFAHCPRCGTQVLVPLTADHQAWVRCRICAAEYHLYEALNFQPPELEILDGPSAAYIAGTAGRQAFGIAPAPSEAQLNPHFAEHTLATNVSLADPLEFGFREENSPPGEAGFDRSGQNGWATTTSSHTGETEPLAPLALSDDEEPFTPLQLSPLPDDNSTATADSMGEVVGGDDIALDLDLAPEDHSGSGGIGKFDPDNPFATTEGEFGELASADESATGNFGFLDKESTPEDENLDAAMARAEDSEAEFTLEPSADEESTSERPLLGATKSAAGVSPASFASIPSFPTRRRKSSGMLTMLIGVIFGGLLGVLIAYYGILMWVLNQDPLSLWAVLPKELVPPKLYQEKVPSIAKPTNIDFDNLGSNGADEVPGDSGIVPPEENDKPVSDPFKSATSNNTPNPSSGGDNSGDNATNSITSTDTITDPNATPESPVTNPTTVDPVTVDPANPPTSPVPPLTPVDPANAANSNTTTTPTDPVVTNPTENNPFGSDPAPAITPNDPAVASIPGSDPGTTPALTPDPSGTVTNPAPAATGDKYVVLNRSTGQSQLAELASAISDSQTALAAWQAASTDKVAKMTAYKSLVKLGDVISSLPPDADQAAIVGYLTAIRGEMEKLSQNPTQLAAMVELSPLWLTAKKRTNNGVLLLGEVVADSTAAATPGLHKYKLATPTAKPNEPPFTIYSAQPLIEGQVTLLGTIVDAPTTLIPGYTGTDERVIWVSVAPAHAIKSTGSDNGAGSESITPLPDSLATPDPAEMNSVPPASEATDPGLIDPNVPHSDNSTPKGETPSTGDSPAVDVPATDSATPPSTDNDSPFGDNPFGSP
ncbi:MAG: hypothetical protein SFX18_13130 [Pirellulales bacterium]|nr:hypothetical protein [Pirellulales bacterium]